MHTPPYFSVVSYVDCDVGFCSEYLYLRYLLLLQEARNFIHKWSVIKKCRERYKAEIDNLFRTCQTTFRSYLYYFRKSFVTQLL